MADAMNRAARRRAAREGKTGVKVRCRNRIDLVPMEHMETYYRHEIASEGEWGSGRKLIVVRPSVDAGGADDAWFARMLEKMRETRRRKGTQPMKLAVGDGLKQEIDIGLVDVTVFFEMPPGYPPSLPTTREEYDMTFTENCRHFDSVCAGALHDQMIIATVMHRYHTNGSWLLHYHNLIFGLRQEVRGNVEILGPLDIDPLLKTLSKTGPLNVIGGMKQ